MHDYYYTSIAQNSQCIRANNVQPCENAVEPELYCNLLSIMGMVASYGNV